MSREEVSIPKKYYSIIQGNWRTQVPEDHPDAVRRDWESADGKTKGTKYERVVKALIGYIKNIQIVDGEYGMQINVMFDPDEEGDLKIAVMGAKTREGESFLKKLPNIDLKQEVRLRPFNFNDKESNEEVRGMEVTQLDDDGKFKKKIGNFFYDSVSKEYLNGFPAPQGNTEDYSKDDWKIYFLQANKWLVNYINTEIIPKFAVVNQEMYEKEQKENEDSDEVNPDDIPF